MTNPLSPARRDSGLPAGPGAFSSENLGIQQATFVAVEGLAEFWNEEDPARGDTHFATRWEDFLVGMGGVGQPFLSLVIAAPRRVQIYFGFADVQGEAVAGGARPGVQALRAALPGIRLGPERDGHALGNVLAAMPVRRRVQGFPTDKICPVTDPVGGTMARASSRQVERVLEGLFGITWAFLVAARPLSVADATKQSEGILAEWRRMQLARFRPGEVEREADPRSAVEHRHYEALARRASLFATLGAWDVRSTLMAVNARGADYVQSLVLGVFGGDDAMPYPLRVGAGSGGGVSEEPAWSSRDLAVLTRPPRQEFPGYALRPFARFRAHVAAAHATDEPSIRVGEVQNIAGPSGNHLGVRSAELVKHGLVVGVTGSGKTNTCFHLLAEAWKQGVPFLVIEPAKREYRGLRHRIAGLQVLTVGDETENPLRWNPFEFHERTSVQTHIDHLKTAFLGSFVWFAPMQYVLEQALHRVYEERGWDLASSVNRRGIGAWVYPTMQDLYRACGEIAVSSGYDPEITSNVKAGLETRLRSLMIGGKGRMFDVRRGTSFAEILSRPTVLELGAIGNDEEKAFLMGLLLARLYDFREQENRQAPAVGLRHLTLVEEAHRLLAGVESAAEGESASIRARAAESFGHLLAEIRAYGEGILIAEQIPTKLIPDAIKNTNLKILHRTVALDDRKLMGDSMQLDENQTRFAGTLETGEALAFSTESPGAYRIVVPLVDTKPHLGEGSDEGAAFQTASAGGDDRLVATLADRLASRAQLKSAASRWLAALRHGAASPLGPLREMAQREIASQNSEAALRRVLDTLAEEVVDLYGRRGVWSVDRCDEVLFLLEEAVEEAFKGESGTAARTLSTLSATLAAEVPPPYVGCSSCAFPCRFGMDVLPGTRDEARISSFARLYRADRTSHRSDRDFLLDVAAVARGFSSELVPGLEGLPLEALEFCIAISQAAALGLPAREQRTLGRALAAFQASLRGN